MNKQGSALLFGGQGTQYPGMGKKLYEADGGCRKIFEIGSRVFDIDLAELCFCSGQETLNRTEYTQPGVLAVDLCSFWLAKRTYSFEAAAGFSLGEYAALAAVGAITIEEAFFLVKKRTRAMLAAVPPAYGMSALLHVTMAEAQALCSRVEAGRVYLSNHSSSEQISVSGDEAGLEQLHQIAGALGVKVLRLRVNMPFHCELMQPAAQEFSAALNEVEIKIPALPLYMNATGRPADNPEVIRELLVEQIYKPVLWKETLEALYADGCREFLECGPKNISGRLLRESLGEKDTKYSFFVCGMEKE